MSVSSQSSGPHQFKAFRDRVDQYRDIWNSIDIRYSALEFENAWYNVVSEVRLHPDPPSPIANRVLVDLPDFRAGRESLDISELQRLLDGVEGGRVELGGIVIRLESLRIQPGKPNEVYPIHPFFQIQEPGSNWSGFWEPEKDSLAFVSVGHGNSLYDFVGEERWNRWDRALLLLKPSYFGLEDLFFYDLRANPPHSIMGAPRFSVRAPLYTRIEGTDLTSGNRILVTISAPRHIRRGDLRAVARGIGGDRVVRLEERPEGDPASPLGDGGACISLDASELDWIDCAVIFRQERVGRFQFFLPSRRSSNPRLACIAGTELGTQRLNAFVESDPGLEKLDNGQEIGLGWLLALCGFQIINTGLKGYNMGATPDLIAFVPFSRCVAVFEATSRDLMTGGKLVKLHDRVEAIRAQLPEFEVLSVVSTLKSSLTEPEVDLAKRLGIQILSKPELQELLQIAERNEPPARAFEYLRGLIKRPSN